MQLLVIKIKASGATPEYALLGKKQTSNEFTLGDWKRIRSMTRGRRVLVLIPPHDVVITSVNIPSKNKKQLLQAIPFSLEDTLADDIENLHFAVKQDDSSNHSQVAIIKRNKLEKHLNTLQENGVTAHFILPETLGQFYRPDAWSLLFNSDRLSNNQTDNHQQSVSVRLDEFNGFVCDESMIEMFLLNQKESKKPNKIYANIDKESLPQFLQELDFESIDSNAIDYKSVLSALPLNLITNYTKHTNKSTINWSAWRPTFVIGGLLASIWAGVFFWQNNLMQYQSKKLNEQMVQLFKESFPNSRNVDDAATRMEIELKTLKKNIGATVDSPLPLISDISPLLKEFKDVALSEINYKENELTLTMQSPSLTRLETLKREAAEKVKLKVDIKSSTTTSNKVKAILIISPLAASASRDNLLNKDTADSA